MQLRMHAGKKGRDVEIGPGIAPEPTRAAVDLHACAQRSDCGCERTKLLSCSREIELTVHVCEDV
jgi:hypothetical protein